MHDSHSGNEPELWDITSANYSSGHRLVWTATQNTGPVRASARLVTLSAANGRVQESLCGVARLGEKARNSPRLPKVTSNAVVTTWLGSEDEREHPTMQRRRESLYWPLAGEPACRTLPCRCSGEGVDQRFRHNYSHLEMLGSSARAPSPMLVSIVKRVKPRRLMKTGRKFAHCNQCGRGKRGPAALVGGLPDARPKWWNPLQSSPATRGSVEHQRT